MAHFERKTELVIEPSKPNLVWFFGSKFMSSKNLTVHAVRLGFCARFSSQIALMHKSPSGEF